MPLYIQDKIINDINQALQILERPTIFTTTIVPDLLSTDDDLCDKTNDTYKEILERLAPSLSKIEQYALDKNSSTHDIDDYDVLSYFTHNRTTSDDYTEILLTLQDLEYNSSNHLQWIALYSVLQLGFAIAGDFESYKHVTSNLMLRRVYAGDYESAEMNGLQLARCYNNTGNLVEYKQELEYMLSDKILSEGTHIYQPSYLSELYAHLALGGAYAMSEHTAKAASTHYGKADALKPGPTDYDAYRVEQHEVGFSNNEPIGTDNIQQCIVLIVHDSKNYDTALAHVDRFTDYNSLCTEVIEKIDPRKEKQLNVY